MSEEEKQLTQKEQNAKIISLLENVVEKLDSLAVHSTTSSPLAQLQKGVNTTIATTFVAEALTSSATSNPIPLEYRQIVDDVLNKSFGIEINPRADLPAFEFVVKVPKKYSNAPNSHWEMYKSDNRPRVISYSDGLLGVRQWCEKVFDNFNQDTRTIIVNDRVSAQ